MRGIPRRPLADRGSATAELAVALPAVALVLAACMWGLQLAAAQVRLQDSVALAARALGRGESPPGGVAATSWRDGELVCASASRPVGGMGLLPGITLAAASCALADGG